jgi:cerevisin
VSVPCSIHQPPIMKFLALSLLSIAASANPLVRIGTIHHDSAPLLSAANAKPIPNSYIIKFKDHVNHKEAAAHHAWVQDIHDSHETKRLELRKRSQIPFLDDAFRGLKHTFNIANNFLGYAGHFDDAVIEQLRRHPDVSLPICAVATHYRISLARPFSILMISSD